ncbi:hypothetical protein GCM10010124_40900 [Pilimelia terevasa]|uniref:histidine kinase n=1 Tax=Pilimelia terevasa TaxID=53372 RepID=A0A8J3BUE0_9ACTN|nr:hypothetical protein GCM10010124_40900 [Pilimelia terevasa]
MLADLASALTAGAGHLNAVLDIAVQASARHIGDGSLIRLAEDDGTLSLASVHHPDAAVADLIRLFLLHDPGIARQRITEGFSGIVLRSGRPHVQAVSQEQVRAMAAPQFRPLVERLGAHAVMITPLFADGTYRGYLATFRLAGSQPFSAADIALGADIAGRVALAVTVARSVEQLRLSEDRYRRIVEHTQEGIAQLDRTGRVVFANARLAEILGVPPETLEGDTLHRFMRAEDRRRLPARLAARLRGRAETYEQQMFRGDGRPIWVNISATPILDADDQPAGSLGLLTDITDGVRARELERQLEQVRRLDSLGQLAGGVAHDFNNLLGVIGGFAELVRDEDDPAERQAAAAQILAAVHRGAALTGQLLAFGRGRPGRPEVTELPPLLRELEPLLRQAAGEHVQLCVAVPPDTARITVAPGHVEQILVNLVVNARDAMPTGGTVRIECADRIVDARVSGDPDHPPRPGRYVRLAVSDTGTGMDEDTLRRVFEPFFTTKPTGQGTGLGLAGVYGIVRAADGHVAIRSRPQVGTTVKVFLPATAARPAPPPAPDAAAPAAALPAVRARVLVVEDNPTMAAVVARMLRDTPYHVTVVTQVDEAVARVAGGPPPDLLVTDVVMPVMSGPELAAVLRSRVPDLGVVYVSGYTAGALTMSGQLDRDAPLVEKPFRQADLLAALAAAHAARPSRVPAGRAGAAPPPARPPADEGSRLAR